uniref:PpSP15-like protein n=1 Tax=Sergentomyia schwetzi TaxID=114605 RepID=A0A6B9VJT0_9DIPT|nr:PpSP15-like protein [Sergentomyia schwetzi]
MKSSLFFVCLCVLFWLGPADSQKSTSSKPVYPFDKCRDENPGELETCITHCTYTYYKLAKKNFKIPNSYILNFKNILLDNNVVSKDKANQLEKHIKTCANTFKKLIAKEQGQVQKCRKFLEYYRCVVDGKLVDYNKYATAIIAKDKSMPLEGSVAKLPQSKPTPTSKDSSKSVHPSHKCRKTTPHELESCILHCEYTYYNLVNKDFEIPQLYIENLRELLLHYKVVEPSKGKKLEEHIKGCAKKFTKAIAKEREQKQKCSKVIEYYHCIINGKLFDYNKFVYAIRMKDESIYV